MDNNVSYDFLIKNFVTLYIEQGAIVAGAYAFEHFPKDWRDRKDEWQTKVREEFRVRGFELATPNEAA